MVRQYLKYRDKKQLRPRGLVVAEIVDHQLRIGWSLCDERDTFTKATASNIAIGRMDTAPILADARSPQSVLHAIMDLKPSLQTTGLRVVAKLYGKSLTDNEENYLDKVL